MTEDQWQACGEPQTMLRFLQGRVSERKLRLFACACCRRIWERLADLRSRRAVETAEGLAVTSQELWAAHRQAAIVADALDRQRSTSRARRATRARQHKAHRAWCAAAAATRASGNWGLEVAADYAAQAAFESSRQRDEERRRQADLLRDIVGNPFRPLAFDTAVRQWNGGAAVVLAREMYDGRDFGKAPLLADMLEDAGVNDGQFLEHLRGPGPHARGCFGVDLVLGRE
jgi:hypothetical protein